MKFRKKPIEIEAIQWTGHNADDVADFMGDRGSVSTACVPASVVVVMKEGTMKASVGDWIIRGVAGEFYPCKPDIFSQCYETSWPTSPAES